MGQDEELFLDITEPVWTPASPSEGKLVGQHTFPFSITIPRDVTIAPAPKAEPKSFPLPPTFSERASPAYIDYRLFLTVRRGRLRVNKQCVYEFPSLDASLENTFRLTDGRLRVRGTDRLSTNFAFIPRTVAEPPSTLRLQAYVEGGMILGPDADPEGWKVYDPVKMTGTLFGTREVSVECTVSDPLTKRHHNTTDPRGHIRSLR